MNKILLDIGKKYLILFLVVTIFVILISIVMENIKPVVKSYSHSMVDNLPPLISNHPPPLSAFM